MLSFVAWLPNSSRNSLIRISPVTNRRARSPHECVQSLDPEVFQLCGWPTFCFLHHIKTPVKTCKSPFTPQISFPFNQKHPLLWQGSLHHTEEQKKHERAINFHISFALCRSLWSAKGVRVNHFIEILPDWSQRLERLFYDCHDCTRAAGRQQVYHPCKVVLEQHTFCKTYWNTKKGICTVPWAVIEQVCWIRFLKGILFTWSPPISFDAFFSCKIDTH